MGVSIIVFIMRWLNVKSNYFLYVVLIFIVIFRSSFINFLFNINNSLFKYDNVLEINYLKEENERIKDEYNKLIDFKNNISSFDNYIVTNRIINSYNFNNLIINGTNYNLYDEVLSGDGLVGIITKIDKSTSEVEYIYNTNIPVIINDIPGKIKGKDNDNNLIISDISNYNNINLNDYVYSINDTYIGRVIDFIYNDFSVNVIVKTVSLDNLNYLLVRTHYDNWLSCN